jgi:hypothetical protein
MEERRPNPIEKLTIPGRLLLVATIVLFGFGFYFTFFVVVDNFSSSRYPIIVMLIPPFVVGFLFFLAAAWLLERCGIQIYANKSPK